MVYHLIKNHEVILQTLILKNLRQWTEVDSNHRSNLQQIYSLSPLATRESVHMILYIKADKRTRTVNLLITNQLLCQLSHIGI